MVERNTTPNFAARIENQLRIVHKVLKSERVPKASEAMELIFTAIESLSAEDFVSQVPENASAISSFQDIGIDQIDDDKIATLEDALKDGEKLLIQLGVKTPFPAAPEENFLTLSAYSVPKGLGAIMQNISVPRVPPEIMQNTVYYGTRIGLVLVIVGGLFEAVRRGHIDPGCYISAPDEGESGPYNPISCRWGYTEIHPAGLFLPPAQRLNSGLRNRDLQGWNPLYQFAQDDQGQPVLPENHDKDFPSILDYDRNIWYPPMSGSPNLLPVVFPENFESGLKQTRFENFDRPNFSFQRLNGKAENEAQVEDGVLRSVIYFETGESELNPLDQSDLQATIIALTEKGITEVTVYGQTDTVGETGRNQELAAERIASVSSALEKAGIQVRAVNRGEQGAEDDVPEDNQRLVEIVSQSALEFVMTETDPSMVLLDSSFRGEAPDHHNALLAALEAVPQVFESNKLTATPGAEHNLKTWSPANLESPYTAELDGLNGEISDILTYIETNLQAYQQVTNLSRSINYEDGESTTTVKLTVRPIEVTIIGNALNMRAIEVEALIERTKRLEELYGLTVRFNYYVDSEITSSRRLFADQVQTFVKTTGGQYFEAF